MIKVMFGDTPNETASLPYYLLFFSNIDIVYNSSPDSSVLAILWSVAIEEQFYLFWPLLLTICPKKAYLKVFAALVLLSFLFRLYHADSYLILNLHTFSCISDMVVGGIFAVLCIYSTAFIAQVKKAPKFVWISLYVAVLVLYLFTRNIFHHTGILYALERLVISILFALIIVEQCFAERSFYKMSKFKTISRLGVYTFGLYCLHPIGALIANKGLGYFSLNDNIYTIVFLETPVSFAVTITLALLSYHLYEKRFLLLKDRFARIRKH
jgi:peptidoglycan/LPS O-acetylase OafA/YrhL